LLKKVVEDTPKIADDLRKAVDVLQTKGIGKGHPDVINTFWPEGTIARADIEGLLALRKQVPETLEALSKQVPETLEELQSRGTSASSASPAVDPSEVFSSVVNLVTDPEKQRELREEVANGLRSTPKGLETPKYRVVRTLDGPTVLGKPEKIEVREYEDFTVARTDMQAAEDDAYGSPASANGFNTLAGYLFGGNEQKQSMAMTMPVEITTTFGEEAEGRSSSMAFVLPKAVADAPPTPDASSIGIEQVPKRLVAVKAFPGIVTSEEVARQRTALLDALAKDGVAAPVDDAEVITLQYNSPLTLPWRRRNELAVVVTMEYRKLSQAPEVPSAAEREKEAELIAEDVLELNRGRDRPAPEVLATAEVDADAIAEDVLELGRSRTRTAVPSQEALSEALKKRKDALEESEAAVSAEVEEAAKAELEVAVTAELEAEASVELETAASAERDVAPSEIDQQEAAALKALEAEYSERSATIRQSFEEQRGKLEGESP
jgi:hypothetical protein